MYVIFNVTSFLITQKACKKYMPIVIICDCTMKSARHGENSLRTDFPCPSHGKVRERKSSKLHTKSVPGTDLIA